MTRTAPASSTLEGLGATLESLLVDRLASIEGPQDVVRVGADVQEVEAVEQALTDHPGRYLRHLFTVEEQADLGWPTTGPTAMAPAAACRFAAKEAVVKALDPSERTWTWREIAVREAEHWELSLSGEAHLLSIRRGITHWVLSCVSDAHHAVALAVGVGPNTNTSADQTTELGGA